MIAGCRRVVTCNHGEGRSPYGYNSKRRRAASDHAADKHMQEKITLKNTIAELMDRVNQGISVSSYAYNDVLKRCAKERDLESVKRVHGSVKDSQMEQHPYVGTMLLKCYIECGRLKTAEETLNKLLKKRTEIWNMMIAGHVKLDQAEGAVEMYKRMRNEGGQPDTLTYMSVLKACASPTALKWGQEIHAHIIRDCLLEDVRVGSSLVQMYSKCGSIEDARAVFRKLSRRNVVSWNVMIGGLAEHGLGHEAFSFFLEMQRKGFTPDAITYLSILNPRSSSGALEWVKEVHAYATRAYPVVDVRVENALMQMYSKSGSIEDARAVFAKMSRRDIVSWNVMIGELAEHGLGEEAFSLFLEMQSLGFTPNAITYLSILNPRTSRGALEWVKEVHAHAMRANPDGDVRVESALVQMYGKSGSIEDARAVFGKMRRRNVFSWNLMIGELADHGLGYEAFSFFLQMQSEGVAPDAITYLNILNPRSSSGALEWVKEVHAHTTRTGSDVDVRVANALVQMYGKSGSIEDARVVFDKMDRRDIISWNLMIGELAEHGLGHEAFSLFMEMQNQGFTPDSFTYSRILNPCSSCGAADWVKKVHAHAMESGFDVDLKVANALVQMYHKTGLICDAKRTFENMRIRDVASWVMMISGLAQHGQGRQALELFEKMKTEGVKPNEALFAVVLSACSHAGLVEEGRLQFDSMSRDYGIEPALEHYTCMVDTLGRAGRLKEAELFILNMPIKPNFVTWSAFLGACRTHKNLELAEVAARECLKLSPAEASPYVLLSNVYAAVGNWDQVTLIRSMMKKKGILKEPGRCWIEIGNQVHEFQVGDTSHPETREIYSMLSTLSEQLKAEGYIPDTRLVLRNIAEEDKESALCSHSEKLAIAYGLMHVPPGEPIRLYKNLRICTDCHAVTKLISRFTGREIIARDANRFHHFKDGSCSCDDYW